MTLFLDLDNTILPSKEAYAESISKLASFWKQKGWGEEEDFLSRYEDARKTIKQRLKGHSSNRLRILCFKEMVSGKWNGISVKKAETILDLESKYFEFFTDFLKKERNKNPDWDEVFSLLKLISINGKIFFLTNENLRTQLLKIQSFFPSDLRFHLITSEDLGVEKPDKKYFNFALEEANSSPKDCFMVGDSLEDDIEGAKRKNIPAIYQKQRFGENIEIRNLSETPFVLESENLISTLNYIKTAWKL
ncbi:HAD family hydrolase [Leptospira ilyithenensis]|uniref:HAD family hydrolase n=1 Tax=Leptospira ilyithenensis TaxID=2484901 RepID=A0A4V3JWM9_9LEPT|nr:HAD family hydrolase [Leptospira ilyithenensis]TGN06889.1 HAD family hydrolase [Leptospira ilyithenensis]